MEKKNIIHKCLDYLIQKLEEDISSDIKFGKFVYSFYNLGVKIRYLSWSNSHGLGEYSDLIDYDLEEYPKIIYFWYNKNKKTEYAKLNKLYILLKKRNIVIEKQKEIEKNKILIDCLPEDQQKQIYREAKLKRIIDEN